MFVEFVHLFHHMDFINFFLMTVSGVFFCYRRGLSSPSVVEDREPATWYPSLLVAG